VRHSRFDEDENENNRDESREMATDIMVTSTTKLTLFPIILTRFIHFALASLKTLGADLGDQAQR